ncbi:hypothetical protein GCM10010211_85670 [Streptomyces albospinus]|uniref:Uncharacterized protein n=1 Tax=Streptomyces albospinus TaxID=285515 RepID=A0ABQ2VRZ2_9ACTN|nr:hypothetical protein GCM10010211_85670 [Streptomyces albospinus]
MSGPKGPDARLADEPGCGTPDDVRDAYVTHLASGARASARWLPIGHGRHPGRESKTVCAYQNGELFAAYRARARSRAASKYLFVVPEATASRECAGAAIELMFFCSFEFRVRAVPGVDQGLCK